MVRVVGEYCRLMKENKMILDLRCQRNVVLYYRSKLINFEKLLVARSTLHPNVHLDILVIH